MSKRQRKHPNSSKPSSRPDVRSVEADPIELGRTLGERLQLASASLVSLMIVWSFLLPNDAISVFQGHALAQNLFWLITGCLCAGAAYLVGGFSFSRIAWVICLIGLAWLSLAAWHAGLENNPRRAWNGFWQVIALASCYFCARQIVVGPLSRASIVAVCLAGFLACSVHGIYQVQIGLPAARAIYEENPEKALADAEITAPAGSPQRRRFEDRLRSTEPYAWFALANSLATILTAALVLLAGFLVLTWLETSKAAEQGSDAQPQARPPPPSWQTWVAGVTSLGVLMLCWFLTLSRSAYIAVPLAAVLGLSLYWYRQPRVTWNRTQLIVAASVMCMLILGGGLWLANFNRLVLSEARKSLEYRIEYWQATLAMIADHWLWGVGLGNFQSYYPQYKLPIASEEVADPHNWLLDMAASLGVAVACLLAIWLAVRLIKSCRREESSHPIGSLAFAVAMDRQTATAIRWGALGGGGVCALLMNLLLNVDVVVIILSWIPATLAAILLWPQLRVFLDRHFYLLNVAVVAMLICLLASGSWQASGIAVPLLALLVAGQRVQQKVLPTQPWPLWMALLGLGIFIIQAWIPSTRSWGQLQQARTASSARQQLELARSAAEADPWDAELKAFVAQAEARDAMRAGLAEFAVRSRQALASLDQWLEGDRHSFANWQQAGDLTLELGEAAQRLGLDSDGFYAKALAYHRGAVQRYPTSVHLNLQMAATAFVQGDLDTARQGLRRAIELSEATPHADKKLGYQYIWLPLPDLPANIKSTSPGMVNAEPLVEWMRTKLSDL